MSPAELSAELLGMRKRARRCRDAIFKNAVDCEIAAAKAADDDLPADARELYAARAAQKSANAFSWAKQLPIGDHP